MYMKSSSPHYGLRVRKKIAQVMPLKTPASSQAQQVVRIKLGPELPKCGQIGAIEEGQIRACLRVVVVKNGICAGLALRNRNLLDGVRAVLDSLEVRSIVEWEQVVNKNLERSPGMCRGVRVCPSRRVIIDIPHERFDGQCGEDTEAWCNNLETQCLPHSPLDIL